MAYISNDDLLSIPCPNCGEYGCISQQSEYRFVCSECGEEFDSDDIQDVLDDLHPEAGGWYESEDEENEGLVWDIDDFTGND